MKDCIILALLKPRHQYLVQLLVIIIFMFILNLTHISISYCEGMNFLDNSNSFIFNNNEKGELTVEYIEKVPKAQKDFPSPLPAFIENPAENKVKFISIESYWEIAKKRGGGSWAHTSFFTGFAF